MYYSDIKDYVGDRVTFYAPDNSVLHRILMPDMTVRYNGENVPVVLNAWKSGFIIKKEE